MVAAVDRHPLARANARRQPEHDAKGHACRARHGESLMAEASMQVDRRAEQGDLADSEANEESKEDLRHEASVPNLPTVR
jgi:hypothetical protein